MLVCLGFSYSKNLKGTVGCSHKINLQTTNTASAPQVPDEDLVLEKGLTTAINCESKARKRLLVFLDTKKSQSFMYTLQNCFSYYTLKTIVSKDSVKRLN